EDAQQSGSFSRDLNPNDCRSAECATEYRRLFDASFAVQMRLLGTGGKVRGVIITITESPTATFTANTMVEGADVKGAIQAAYSAAREKHLRGEGPWLSAEGSPAGAVVYLDGLEYGTVPFERRYVEGGSHRVDVRKDGYITQGFQVQIPNRIDHEERLQVKLALIGGAPVVERRIDRTWDYVLGGLVMAAGGAHLAMGIQQKLKAGDCAEQDEAGECTRVYGSKSGTKENALLGFGAAGVAIGVILIGVAPIGRVRLQADRQSAALTFSGGF
ncbi:MAG TPA: PEGA domain-containing protein, partial [Polyangiales bacterium]